MSNHFATFAGSLALWRHESEAMRGLMRGGLRERQKRSFMNTSATVRMLGFAVALVASGSDGWAQKPPSEFKDYPVKEIYHWKNAPIVLTKEDRMFRTRLTNAAKEKPNFAGRYIVTTWGCGAECLMGVAIDAKTGNVHKWGFSVCCWGDVEKPVDFRLDSSMIVFYGLRNEEGSKGPHYYRVENGRFIQLRM